MKKRSDILWTSTEAAAVTGGHSTGAWQATGIRIRAEDIKRGDLFVASEGESLDLAYKNGAAAAIVSHVPDGKAFALPLLKVMNTYEALHDLARAARFRTHATILAVQGREVRTSITKLFGLLGHAHDGGKILSVGMANMPEDFDYGIFPLAPSVRPDIAVITGGRDGVRDGLFQNMSSEGTVILNRDCADFLEVATRARAAGIRNLMSIGRSPGADACIVETLQADNGTRIKFEILGETLTLIADDSEAEILAAALLAARLCGHNLQTAARALKPQPLIRRQVEGLSVSLFDAVPKRRKSGQAVFRVQNMIDLGSGRQTAILDNISFPAGNDSIPEKNGLDIPRRLANLDLVYTCKTVTGVPSVHDAIRHIGYNGALEKIAPEVIAPGDFVIFEQGGEKDRAVFAGALRLKPKRKKQAKNAL